MTSFLIGVISVICGVDFWNEMELYTQKKGTRYYISSLDSNEKVFQNAIRSYTI